MRIATWNVNSDQAAGRKPRAPGCKERQPDIVCLQETKCQDEAFPREPFEALGYNVAIHGQKTFNGVAILSKLAVRRGDAAACRATRRTTTPASSRPWCRHRPARCASRRSTCPMATRRILEKYAYKIKWMKRLFDYSRERLKLEEPLVLAGDYNVIPAEADVHNPEALGRRRAVPARDPRQLSRADQSRPDRRDPRHHATIRGLYTFWDYQAGAWQKNNGIRIDHLLLSPQAADRLVTAGIDKHVRAWEKPSDHVPVWIELDLETEQRRSRPSRHRFRRSRASSYSRLPLIQRASMSPAIARSSLESPASAPIRRARRSRRPTAPALECASVEPHQPARRLARQVVLALEQHAAEHAPAPDTGPCSPPSAASARPAADRCSAPLPSSSSRAR